MVQGITGREGAFHAKRCMEYGTQIVAGVTPGKGGTVFEDCVPVFDTVEKAIIQTKANTSLIFVPAPFAQDALLEAIDVEVPLIICITEGLPPLDTAKVVNAIQQKPIRVIGPNCPGIITPGDNCKVGIMPGNIHFPGKVGIVSRSGTLTYEAVSQLTALGIGQSTCIGIGGDSIVGTTFADALELFENDPETNAIVLIGEIGGTKEQEAAEFISSDVTKPVIASIVGITAPVGKRMGHAGAIVTGSAAKAIEKMTALESAGCYTVQSPALIGESVQQALTQLG